MIVEVYISQCHMFDGEDFRERDLDDRDGLFRL